MARFEKECIKALEYTKIVSGFYVKEIVDVGFVIRMCKSAQVRQSKEKAKTINQKCRYEEYGKPFRDEM